MVKINHRARADRIFLAALSPREFRLVTGTGSSDMVRFWFDNKFQSHWSNFLSHRSGMLYSWNTVPCSRNFA